MSALLTFFELFNVSSRDYDCLGAGNKVSWLISCLTLSGLWLHAAPSTSCLTSRVLSHFSPVQLCVTLWSVAHQAPLCLGFSRQEYWSGLPFSSPGDLPNPGVEPRSLMSPAFQAGSLPLVPPATFITLAKLPFSPSYGNLTPLSVHANHH